MFIEQIVNVKDLFMCLFIVLGIYGLVAEIKIYYYYYKEVKNKALSLP